ncbi:Fatty acid desaturase [Microbacterium sp. ru370.1]|uniref:fatty acid desaturase family protein n=1 Tax=unclassified Microbacterium TaxID=2609290 RepID=UPI0008834789|nr:MULTISPECIES: acyl-CoA desaturase [unclassified Microbacterium]SDO94534.1 Fatty acid desaturase [Microbacterium sp. ru370.1]SIT93145.1 Fatty acid desaturase [Microbacterium sp. RU1D]
MASPTIESRLGPIRQTYKGTTEFPPMAKAYTELSQVIRETGLLTRARRFYALVGVALAVAFGGAVTGFVLLGDSWFQLLIAAAFGILFTQVAFLAHEAAHKQIFASGRANDRLALWLAAGVVGISLSWWTSKHTRHHANPNRVGKDPDIEVDTISFVEEDAATARGLRRWITRRQGWLFFPLLAFEGANLHAHAFRHLFSRGEVKGRWSELGIIALRFAVFVAPVFVFLPLGMAFAFLGVQLAVFGVYMGASFAPNHKGMAVIAPDAKLDFFSKQVRTSRNITGGWWATWLMGGLNYQIEHHLFPNMPRPHLSRARAIVREHSKTLNVPYVETTLLQSYGIVIRYLNRVGLAARDPFECPMTSAAARA